MEQSADLRAPVEHGQVLILPSAGEWGRAVRRNADTLAAFDRPIAGRALAQWRRDIRRDIPCSLDVPLIVAGHQPEFLHAGVWAKFILAARAAEALGGVAVNLVVDTDVPKGLMLRIPVIQGHRLELRTIPFFEPAGGLSFEQLPARTHEQLAELTASVRQAMGNRFAASLMPVFLAAMMEWRDGRDVADQLCAGRRAIDKQFSLDMAELRISCAWWSPLFIEVVENASRFVGCYNKALARYRSAHHVRGTHRPIPDLIPSGPHLEIPFWVYRPKEGRRRLFLETRKEDVRFWAEGDEVGLFEPSLIRRWAEEQACGLRIGDWLVRPRALMLTLWARLFLADFFVHGIGGAQYDKITDTILAEYFKVELPSYACVSATLLLDLPGPEDGSDALRSIRGQIRDLEWNPQRHLPAGGNHSRLTAARAQAVLRAESLARDHRKDRAARAAAFREIRETGAAIRTLVEDTLNRRRVELAEALDRRRDHAIATDREYFIGLFPRARLAELTAALPPVEQFRV
jgi:hypothetical protein